MLKRTIPDVCFSASDIGHAIARGSDIEQRKLLLAWAQGVDDMNRLNGSWIMQCRAIVDGAAGDGGLSQEDRIRIAAMLEDLVDHLREPVSDSRPA